MNALVNASQLTKKVIIAFSIFAIIQTAHTAYMPLNNTPYDQQMKAVRNVIHQQAATGTRVEYSEVMKWMKQIRNYKYSRSQTWHTPEQTEKRRAGDCKDKATLLLSYLKGKGETNVKLVIGKKSSSSTDTHAWVEWKHNGQWIILDPTYDSKPVVDNQEDEYLKQYIFVGSKKYAYVSSNIMMAGL
jgi:transglutaminase-like putative cysteine protease